MQIYNPQKKNFSMFIVNLSCTKITFADGQKKVLAQKLFYCFPLCQFYLFCLSENLYKFPSTPQHVCVHHIGFHGKSQCDNSNSLERREQKFLAFKKLIWKSCSWLGNYFSCSCRHTGIWEKNAMNDNNIKQLCWVICSWAFSYEFFNVQQVFFRHNLEEIADKVIFVAIDEEITKIY